MAAIANEVGCTYQAVKRALKRAGLPIELPDRFPKLRDRVWMERELQTRRVRQIAAELGCSPTAVQQAAKRLGIEIPYRQPKPITTEDSARLQEAWNKRYPNGRFGSEASNWKGGRRKAAGYVLVYAPDHPRVRGKQKRHVQEHILVMEKKLGRYLEPGEIVHHRNHVKDDNRPENLYLTKNGTHIAEHFAEGKRTSEAEARVAELEAELARLKATAPENTP